VVSIRYDSLSGEELKSYIFNYEKTLPEQLFFGFWGSAVSMAWEINGFALNKYWNSSVTTSWFVSDS
jgi:hypothetical protein